MRKTAVLGVLALGALLIAPSKTVVASTDKWGWQLLNTNTVTTDAMIHELTTYERFAQTQDHRWGRVEGVRTAKEEGGSTWGYVRIRFEGLGGNAIKGTDSDREWDYDYSEAETPNPVNYYAYARLRAYCGD